jgi:coproporphyrinogen III oxidase-like Fe-S oxidoreductase
MEKSCLKITLQTRYESLNDDFLDLCQKYNGRVHLEFGLQTIHKNEMETIGRKNDIEKVKTALQKLNERSISYETSIIYAIPGQTMESFIDTIEFLLVNGCKTIRAFPLELAKNSDLASKEKREDWNITTFTDPETKYCTINSSASFYEETRADMDLLAKRLFSDSTLFNGKSKKNCIKWEKDSVYQHIYRFKVLGTGFDEQYLYSLINEYYDKPTLQNTQEIDFTYSMMQTGEMYEESCEPQSQEKHIRKVL